MKFDMTSLSCVVVVVVDVVDTTKWVKAHFGGGSVAADLRQRKKKKTKRLWLTSINQLKFQIWDIR